MKVKSEASEVACEEKFKVRILFKNQKPEKR